MYINVIYILHYIYIYIYIYIYTLLAYFPYSLIYNNLLQEAVKGQLYTFVFKY